MSEWTDERIEKLKLLRSNGYSANQIATELGRLTRNAVIGKIHRLGLPRPLSWPEPKIKKLKRPERPKGPRLTVLGHTATEKRPLPAPKFRDDEIPPEQRKQLVELEPHHCKFPVGDPGEPDFFFCGGEAVSRGYCVEHYLRCHTVRVIQISDQDRLRRHFHGLRNMEKVNRPLLEEVERRQA